MGKDLEEFNVEMNPDTEKKKNILGNNSFVHSPNPRKRVRVETLAAGTYYDKYGGDYGRLVLNWLDWHLKGRQENAKTFLNEKPDGYSGWELKAKNFIDFKNTRSLRR